MRVDCFDFDLPPDRIALRPVCPRDGARLLRVDREHFSDHFVADLPALLRAGDLLVLNDTKVIPAQLEGFRGKALIGATLHSVKARAMARLRSHAQTRSAGERSIRPRVAALVSDKRATAPRCCWFEGD